jgi:hypothetical protein
MTRRLQCVLGSSVLAVGTTRQAEKDGADVLNIVDHSVANVYSDAPLSKWVSCSYIWLLLCCPADSFTSP